MHQNLWWAVGYNVIAFPLAAGVLYPFVLSPEGAALSMSGSTLVVAINALMLKRTRGLSVAAFGQLQIPVSFSPNRMAAHGATLVVENADGLAWRYPLNGRDAQPALVIGRHYTTERDSAPGTIQRLCVTQPVLVH